SRPGHSARYGPPLQGADAKRPPRLCLRRGARDQHRAAGGVHRGGGRFPRTPRGFRDQPHPDGDPPVAPSTGRFYSSPRGRKRRPGAAGRCLNKEERALLLKGRKRRPKHRSIGTNQATDNPMEAAYISALAALAGSAIGGLTSFASSWTTQQAQARAERVANEKDKR